MARFNAMMALQEIVDRTNRNRAELMDQLHLFMGENDLPYEMSVGEVITMLKQNVKVKDLLQPNNPAVCQACKSEINPEDLSNSHCPYCNSPANYK